eukprot:NODE_500_length_6721_cov_0.845492.p4 type:complete len:195 gc:universal NODE_500_length_6721_cov_0.845492:5680-5096(-)
MTKILCLHGYSQDSEIFRKQIGALRRACGKSTIFVFIDGPFKASDCDPTQNGFAFWNPKLSPEELFKNIDVSLSYIQDFITKNGPFDGAIGFSQGSTVITLFQKKYDFKFKFALCFSASKTVSAISSDWFTEKINTKCLHICGSNDEICPATISQDYMLKAYTDIEIYLHKGGHGVPLDKESKTKFKNFINTNC